MMVNISKIRKVLHQAFFRDIGEIFWDKDRKERPRKGKKRVYSSRYSLNSILNEKFNPYMNTITKYFSKI